MNRFIKLALFACIILVLLLQTRETQAASFNCGTWSVVASPNVGSNSNQLYSVDAISVSNIWAVGEYTNSSGNYQTLIENWNGSSWNIIASPNPGSGNDYLDGVVAVSADDIWAVGESPYSNNYQTLIEHWNGTTWNVVTSPPVGIYGSVLSDIAHVPGSGNMWAVGNEVTGNGVAQTLIERWNGKKWSIVPSPNSGTYANYLTGVVALSAKNIWAVGQYENSINGPIQTLIEQWNGSSWNIVASPNPGAVVNTLDHISYIHQTGQLVAVGSYSNILYGSTLTLIEQWNGSSWNVVASPNVGVNYNYLSGVAAITPTNIWAVGAYNNGTSWQTLIERWNGTSWNIVASPNAGSFNNLLYGAARVPNTSKVWAVGYDDNANSSPAQTLTEFNC